MANAEYGRMAAELPDLGIKARCAQNAAEQRRLLQVVVEKAAWQDGTLRTTLFETVRSLAPFEPGKL
jgi:hypothetical protein